MSTSNPKTAVEMISYCGQCQCGCYRLHAHPNNPPERAFSLSTQFIEFGEEFLRKLIAAAPSGAAGIIVHDPEDDPERPYRISAGEATVRLNEGDRADLLERACNGELQEMLDSYCGSQVLPA